MGIDRITLDAVMSVVDEFFGGLSGCDMLELGNQYFTSEMSAQMGEKVVKKWMTGNGVNHVSLDLNGRDGALDVDVSDPLPDSLLDCFDIVTDFGVFPLLEPKTPDARRQWMANMFGALRVGGVAMFSCSHTFRRGSHATRHWNLMTAALFESVVQLNGYDLIHLGVTRNKEACKGCGAFDYINVRASIRKAHDNLFIWPSDAEANMECRQ